MTSKRFQIFTVAVILVLAALWLGACAAAPAAAPQAGGETAAQAGQPAAAEPGQKLKFVAISKTMDNPAFQVAEVGAKDRIEELGGNIELEWTAPTGADPAKEVQMIESYVQRGVDGLLINSLGPAVCQAVNEAMDAGIPVVMWDSDCPDSKRLAYVGSDNYLGGYHSGELYAQAVEGKGPQKIAILTGQPGAFNLQERDRGFKQALDDLGVEYEIVTTVPGFDDLTKSVEAVESTLRGNEEINGFFFDGPWVLLVEPSNTPLLVERVKSGQLTVVSFDTLPQQLKWLDEGLVIGLVGQKYYGWGYQGITVLHNIVANGAQYPPIVNTGVDVVTVEGGDGQFSSADFAGFWADFSFKEEPIMPEDVQ